MDRFRPHVIVLIVIVVVVLAIVFSRGVDLRLEGAHPVSWPAFCAAHF